MAEDTAGSKIFLDGQGKILLQTFKNNNKNLSPETSISIDNNGKASISGNELITINVGESKLEITKEKIVLQSSALEIKNQDTTIESTKMEINASKIQIKGETEIN